MHTLVFCQGLTYGRHITTAKLLKDFLISFIRLSLLNQVTLRRQTKLTDYFEAFHTVHSCSQSILLFQLNAHNMLNTYIYHQLPHTCFGVCYTIFRETTALVAQKCCKKHIVFSNYNAL
jgi:hypothetical protein